MGELNDKKPMSLLSLGGSIILSAVITCNLAVSHSVPEVPLQ